LGATPSRGRPDRGLNEVDAFTFERFLGLDGFHGEAGGQGRISDWCVQGDRRKHRHGARGQKAPKWWRTLMPLSRRMRGDHGLAHARQSGAETVCADALRRHTGAFQQEMELVG
jgi:hypothetical protein